MSAGCHVRREELPEYDDGDVDDDDDKEEDDDDD